MTEIMNSQIPNLHKYKYLLLRLLQTAAARLGFEPRYSDSESEVLPLDDLAKAHRFSAARSSYSLGRVFSIFVDQSAPPPTLASILVNHVSDLS